ncbi:MAG: HAD hydrolase-like protein [Candidatus Vogelbacteria bacterium]|nr:HAD hydrolase-like protein [Candidatus Vogelbacteria bacterium]
MNKFLFSAYRSLRRFWYNKLKVVVFDVDGVLRDSIHFTWQALSATMRDFGVERAPTFEEFSAYYTEPWHRYYANWGVKASNEDILRCYMRHWNKVRHLPQFFPEVREVILRLSALGIKLAIVTMNSETIIRELLREVAIEYHFEVIIGEAEIKSSALTEVCARLQIEPEEAAYVGDLESDMIFAGEAGLWRVAKHPSAIELPENACLMRCEVDERITHLSEVIHFARKRI